MMPKLPAKVNSLQSNKLRCELKNMFIFERAVNVHAFFKHSLGIETFRYCLQQFE